MTDATKSTRRRWVVPIAALSVALALAVVFRVELTGWILGRSIERSTTLAVPLEDMTLRAGLHPDPPRQEDNRLVLFLEDANGTLVTDAEIGVRTFMPAMGAMPQMGSAATVERTLDGGYEASFDLAMGGSWTLIVTIDAGSGPTETRLGFTVGSKGLKLQSADGESAAEDDDAIAYYTCPMHTSVKADAPGQCPICSMDLTPVTHGELKSGILRVDFERLQRIGVRFTKVEREALTRTITTVGEVVLDENRLRDVTVRTAGWVDKLYVEETGELVQRGQALLELYSPEILTGAEELLAARRATSSAKDRLVSAAERKLSLLGMTRAQIAQLVRREQARDRITIAAPTGGYVIEKNVVEGNRVEADTAMFRIADLSEVWIDAQIYEADLPLVKTGQPAQVSLAFVPGRHFVGAIDYVHPRLDPRTRTVRARIVLPNPELVLRPGMFADVDIEVDLGERLVVPQEAVIYAGPRRLVFVDIGDGRLQPRPVSTGVQVPGLVEIVSGVALGERIVASGNFLIAAESRIRSATTIWASTDDDEAAGPTSDEPEASARASTTHESEATTGASTTDETEAPAPERSQRKPAAPAPTKSRPTPRSKPPDPPDEHAHAHDKPSKDAPTIYTCPMHPQVQETSPGQCPICHMDLVAKPRGEK
jgi:Cu(I)/Ag(I) efflux system membrane fusion protein